MLRTFKGTVDGEEDTIEGNVGEGLGTVGGMGVDVEGVRCAL